MRQVRTMLRCLLPVVGVAAVCIGCNDEPAYRDKLPDLPALLGSAVTPPSAIEGASVESTALGGTAGVAEDANLRAKANLHQIDGSGVKARIEFVDDGTTLFINGTAQGLDPSQSYETLIYDNGAHPAGPNACVPTIFDPQDPDSLAGRMLIGFWEVDPDGNGSLTAVNTNFGADYVPIGKFRATSIRRVLGPPPAPGAPPPTALEACGRVAINNAAEE